MGVFSMLILGNAMAATQFNPIPYASGGINAQVEPEAAPNQEEVSQSDLERQISNLEGQLVMINLHGGDAAAFATIKAQLNELYSQRPINRTPSRLDQGGDACSNVTVIPGIPYTDTGSTVGMNDNFTPGCVYFSAAPDVIYQFTPITTGNYTISTCGSSFDTELTLRSGGACPGSNIISCNDDACGIQSTIVTALTGGQTYWIIVDGYNSGGSGAYTLNITDDCSVPCQSGDIPELTENPADPNFQANDPDGGCQWNMQFGAISCGQTVCGVGFTYGNDRYDTDWYRFSISQRDTVTVTITAEFPVQAAIESSDCGTQYAYYLADPCQPLVLQLNCLQPGNYILGLTPYAFSGLATPRHYRATLNCSACQVGRCCYFQAGSPQCETDVLTECNYLYGQWRGDVSCERHPCVPAPTCAPGSVFAQRPDSPFGYATYTSDIISGYRVVQRITTGTSNIGHIRFWGFYLGDTTYVPTNAPFHVEFYQDNAGIPGNTAYFAQDLQITGTPIDAYNFAGSVYQGYQFDADILPSTITDGWIMIEGNGAYSHYFTWLQSPSGNGQSLQYQSGNWNPLGGSQSLCLADIICDPVTQSCPGKTIPATLPYTDRGNTACSQQDMANCFNNASHSVYDLYHFTPNDCQTVTVSLCGSSFDTALEIRTGGHCPGTTSVACNDDYCGNVNSNPYNSLLSFVAMAGQTYYVIVGGYAGSAGAFVLHVTGVPWFMPNDSCPGTAITSLPFSDAGNTVCAHNEVPWSCPFQNYPDGNEVMYSMTLPNCQQVTASLCGSGYDTGIEVRTGGACPGGTTIACNDDHSCPGSNGFQSQVSFNALPGVTYYILVDGWNGSSGAYVLNVTGIPCPDPALAHLVILPQFPSNRLFWRHVPNAVQYSVYRGNTFNYLLDAAHLLATTADTFYVDAGILNTAGMKDFYVVTCISAAPPALVTPPPTLEAKIAAVDISYDGPAIVIPMYNEERAPANKQALALPQQR
jgi:hypothetical protein